jgi:hypothetical protein
MIKSTLFGISIILACSQASAQVSWQAVQPNTAGYYSIASTQNGHVYARLGTTTIVSTTGGASGSWATLTTAPSNTSAALYANNNVLFTLDGTNGAMRSMDYGATWSHANNGLLGSDSTNLTGMVALDSTHWVMLHRGNSVHKVFVSDNNGANWSATLNMFSSQSAISVLSDATGNAYLITNAKVYKSDDWGGYWNDQGATLPSSGAGPTVRLGDGSFLMCNGSSFYKSINEGVTWTMMTSTGLPANAYPRQFIKSPASDTLYMSPEVFSTKSYGLYMSADHGATWAPFDNGLPSNVKLNSGAFAQQLHIAFNGYLFASPDSAAIYRTDAPVTASTVINAATTAVSAIHGQDFAFKMYPNPAQHKLTLSFKANQSISYNIRVTDVMGKLVLSTNSTKVLDVASLTPGTYFVQVRSDKSVATQSFIKQ